MVNNLKRLILRMRFSGTPTAPSKRKQAMDSAREHKRSFRSVSEASRHKTTEFQQEATGIYSTVADVDAFFLGEFTMATRSRVARGVEVEKEFFRQYRSGIELPNVIMRRDEVPFIANYKIAKVKGVQIGDEEPLPPLIDFIAYNDDYWFAMELKSDLRLPNTQRSDKIFFRNWKQIRELNEPGPATVPGVESVRRKIKNLERLPSVVLKRDMIVTQGTGFMSVFNVYSVLPSD